MYSEIPLKKFKSFFEKYKNLIEEVSIDELTFLWFNDFYDGMLCGMLEHKKQKYRFEIITDYTKQSRPRVFAIIYLSEIQIEEETYWHNLFEKHVGSNTAFDLRKELLNRPKSEHHLFYDKYRMRARINYDLNFVKGWFLQN